MSFFQLLQLPWDKASAPGVHLIGARATNKLLSVKHWSIAAAKCGLSKMM